MRQAIRHALPWSASILLATGWAYRKRTRLRRQANGRMTLLVIGEDALARYLAVVSARAGIHTALQPVRRGLPCGEGVPLSYRELFTGLVRRARVRVVRHWANRSDLDLVVVAAPAEALGQALALAKPLEELAPVLVLQPSLARLGLIREGLGRQTALLGSLGASAYDDEVQTWALPSWLCTLTLGECEGVDTERAQQAARVLRRAGLRAEVEPQLPAWFAFQSAMNVALAGALLGCGSPRELVRDRRGQVLYFSLLREASAVLAAHSVPLPVHWQRRIDLGAEGFSARLARLGLRAPCVEPLLRHHLIDLDGALYRDYVDLMELAECAAIPVPSLAALAPFLAPSEA